MYTSTGLLTGNTPSLGIFAMGICVKEYIDGELMSEIRRDFHMQTIVCFDQASITIDTIVQVGTTIGDVIIMKDTFFTNTYDDSNNACDSLVHYIVNIASGITKLPENNYHLYPNPANNVLTVTSKEVLIESIQIFDTQGLNLMMLKDIHSNSVEVSISLLPAGLYILAINNTNSIGIRQIIKL